MAETANDRRCILRVKTIHGGAQQPTCERCEATIGLRDGAFVLYDADDEQTPWRILCVPCGQAVGFTWRDDHTPGDASDLADLLEEVLDADARLLPDAPKRPTGQAPPTGP